MKTNIMNKDFDIIINAVADAMDMRPCEITCRRRYQETIDARWMVVRLLTERGYYPTRIAEWMRMTPRNVNIILAAVNERISSDDNFRRNLETARKQLRNSFS